MDIVHRGNLFDDHAESHHRVGHRECIGVAKIDLLLTWRILVEGIFHGYAEHFECADCFFAQRRCNIGCGEIEESTFIQWYRCLTFFRIFKIEVLNVGGDEELKTICTCCIEIATQHLSRVATKRCSIQIMNVTEHSGFSSLWVYPRKNFKSVGIGDCKNIRFFGTRVSVNGGTIEGHAVVQSIF